MKNLFKKTVVGAAVALAFSGGAVAAPISWTLAPGAGSYGSSSTVLTDSTVTFDAGSDTGGQAAGIYGAGFTVTGGLDVTINFDADLATWDSYNGDAGYYDGFIVSINNTGFYWDTAHTDPFPSDPSSFVWGGTSWSDGVAEYYAPLNVDSVTFAGSSNDTYYVSFVLDTLSSPHTDDQHNSWGSFHVDSVVTTPVPEPETYAMLMAGLGLMGVIARRRKQQA